MARPMKTLLHLSKTHKTLTVVSKAHEKYKSMSGKPMKNIYPCPADVFESHKIAIVILHNMPSEISWENCDMSSSMLIIKWTLLPEAQKHTEKKESGKRKTKQHRETNKPSVAEGTFRRDGGKEQDQKKDEKRFPNYLIAMQMTNPQVWVLQYLWCFGTSIFWHTVYKGKQLLWHAV